jgi:hypothetical protein
MAYYDALIAKWGTLTGTTAQKLTAVNALTVAAPQKVMLSPSMIINACVFSDLAGLTQLQVSQLALLLSGSTIDASVGTSIRSGIQALFAGKTQTLANLAALVAPYDNATIPWWQATVAQGGGGLSSLVSQGDLTAAGIS